MCIIPVVMMILYAGLAVGPLLVEKLNETDGDSSGEEDQKKEVSQDQT